jgi:hypothetical protein
LFVLVVGLGIVVLGAAAGVVVYDRLVGSAAPAPGAGVPGNPFTARRAFVSAVELAGQWQEDAHLAAVSGHWLGVGEGQIEWAFQFYSPATRRLVLIAVADGTPRIVRESVSPYVVSTFDAQEWRVDSDQALQAWWERGGKTLVARRPDVDLAMQLRVSEEEAGQPVWTVVGAIADTETAFTVSVNATDGRLVGQ